MNKNIPEISSFEWLSEILGLHWIKEWRKISYSRIKYQIVKIDNFNIVLSNWKWEWLTKVNIEDFINDLKEWKIRILNKWVSAKVENTKKRMNGILNQKLIAAIDWYFSWIKLTDICALWTALWANEVQMRTFALSLINLSDQFWHINPYLHKPEQDSTSIQTLERIWWYFVWEKYNHLRYNVWCIILMILREKAWWICFNCIELWLDELTRNNEVVEIFRKFKHKDS